MAADNRLFFSVNLPEALVEQIERTAKAENITPDEFVADAVERQIILKRHEALKRFGRQNAQEEGLTEADLPRLIAESRAETR